MNDYISDADLLADRSSFIASPGDGCQLGFNQTCESHLKRKQ
jgi:hypothetical protein